MPVTAGEMALHRLGGVKRFLTIDQYPEGHLSRADMAGLRTSPSAGVLLFEPDGAPARQGTHFQETTPYRFYRMAPGCIGGA